MIKEKICIDCKTNKDISLFVKNGKYYRSFCNECYKIRESNRRFSKIKDQNAINEILENRIIRENCPIDHQHCYICKTYKSYDNFSKTNIKNFGSCRSCSSFLDINRARILKKKAIDHLGGCCNRCGFEGHYASFHFHHINPYEKEMNWNKLLPELNKCKVLCGNCHPILHCKLNDDGSLNSEYIISQ